MVRPIPLADPQGRIYTHACGKCFHVRAGSSLLWWEEDHEGPHASLVEDSLRDAIACCLCTSCRVVEVNKVAEGATFQSSHLCAPCAQAARDQHAWAMFRFAWHRLGEAFEMGHKSLAEWIAYDEACD